MFSSLPALSRFILALILLIISLSACTPAAASPSPTSQPVDPTSISVLPAPSHASTPAPRTAPIDTDNITLTFDLNDLAQSALAETVSAVSPSKDTFWDTVLPQHVRVTLAVYPIIEHAVQPQLFLFLTGELHGWNEQAGVQLDNLRSLLQSQQPVDEMPLMPLNREVQAIHAQVKFLNFKNGTGVRYLTQYNSGIAPVNNHQLFYTFQGMTSDKQVYVSAVLPVNHPDLPATSQLDEYDQGRVLNDYQGHLARTIEMLNGQPNSTFTPDLTKLDALVMSIEVK